VCQLRVVASQLEPYLWSLVVDSDLVVFVQILTGKERLQRLVDLNKEAARLHGRLIC
jgi:hypothetical protein